MHSICRWSFGPGHGGFVPGDVRPSWGEEFTFFEMIKIIDKEIRPHVPEGTVLGVEAHFDNEIDFSLGKKVAKALKDAGLYLAMITPGCHTHWAYGGPSSVNEDERNAAKDFSKKTVDLAYEMKDAWHPEAPPSLVLWNGSWGYDMYSPVIYWMYQYLQESIAQLCEYEKEQGDELYITIEAKGNEGHPAMLLPTIASVISFWYSLFNYFGVDSKRKGSNKELGHDEMLGLDIVHSTIEEMTHKMILHAHMNSQGGNDGVNIGGSGKFDIDLGTTINAANITVAYLLEQYGYQRWFGHDMQPRPYDVEEIAVKRIIRSIIAWEACRFMATKMDAETISLVASKKRTDIVADTMRRLMSDAGEWFDGMKGK